MTNPDKQVQIRVRLSDRIKLKVIAAENGTDIGGAVSMLLKTAKKVIHR